jgi:hypothetical protein
LLGVERLGQSVATDMLDANLSNAGVYLESSQNPPSILVTIA